MSGKNSDHGMKRARRSEATPKPDRPGKLNPQTYADLTAFLLAKNGYQPVEAELPPDPAAQQHMDLKR